MALVTLVMFLVIFLYFLKNINTMISFCLSYRYLSQGFFAVVGTLTLPFIGGILKSNSRQYLLIWIIFWNILVHRYAGYYYSAI